VGPRAGLNSVEQRKILHCRKWKAGSQSLYRLSYPDSVTDSHEKILNVSYWWCTVVSCKQLAVRPILQGAQVNIMWSAFRSCHSKFSSGLSKSKLCYDRRSAGQSVLEQSTHLGLTTRSLLLVWQLQSCSCGAPSLTRGRVCPLYMLLVLASAVFLGSESLGTWDHILLSHIWDFPFRRLLRLAGSTVEVFDPASTRYSGLWHRIIL
jgi:hypothetical protein